VVRRILAHHRSPGQDSGGPSWLTFLGHMKAQLVANSRNFWFHPRVRSWLVPDAYSRKRT
jgi:hypothetical protein